jgi:uncharacterized protein YbjT (DUF2867 family)
MHIITGGTGHVGSALAEALLKKGENVTIVSRSSKNAKEWLSKGAQMAVADIYDTAALHEIFKTGKSVFILNPPADPMTNTPVQERKTIASLLEALKYSGVEKVVVESVIAAQPGDNIGDLGVLYDLEQGIAKLSYPYSIIRPGYYMSNWAESLSTIEEKGEVISFYPADLKMPMIAPKDIGELAAQLMTEKNSPKINAIQGPEIYSANDVAAAFSKALGRNVTVQVIPKDKWKATYILMGFSEEAAESYTRMAEVSLNYFEKSTDTSSIIKGRITLQEYVDSLINN